MTDFPAIIAALASAQVRFIVVGGVAAIVHGSARHTLDIDIVYERSDDNIGRLVRALASHAPYLRGAPPGLPFVLDERTIKSGLNFTLTTSLGDLDILGHITGGGTYADLLEHSVHIQVFGSDCLCLDLSTLIHVKRAAGRPKDLEAIAELELLLDEQHRDRN